MTITSLNIHNFRNFESLSASFEPGINIFYGNNGSGKSNLLEAIFTLCLGRSQRRAADSVMVRSGQEVYRLEGQVQLDGRQTALTVAYQRQTKKKVTIDQVPARVTELYDQFCAVALGPEDSDILSGAPSLRRHFLDLHLSQLSAKYLSDLVDYQKVIQQKNAALKQEMDPSMFDRLLVEYGARIMQARSSFLSELSALAETQYAEVAGGETLAIHYQPVVPMSEAGMDGDAIQASFRDELDKYVSREAMLRTALIGPHRDEIEFRIGGLAARSYASQGQWRTAAVALKLAVLEILRKRRQTAPILLLDEIFAELDAARTERLMEIFAGGSQIFLTTALEGNTLAEHSARRYHIVAGRIEEIT